MKQPVDVAATSAAGYAREVNASPGLSAGQCQTQQTSVFDQRAQRQTLHQMNSEVQTQTTSVTTDKAPTTIGSYQQNDLIRPEDLTPEAISLLLRDRGHTTKVDSASAQVIIGKEFELQVRMFVGAPDAFHKGMVLQLVSTWRMQPDVPVKKQLEIANFLNLTIWGAQFSFAKPFRGRHRLLDPDEVDHTMYGCTYLLADSGLTGNQLDAYVRKYISTIVVTLISLQKGDWLGTKVSYTVGPNDEGTVAGEVNAGG